MTFVSMRMEGSLMDRKDSAHQSSLYNHTRHNCVLKTRQNGLDKILGKLEQQQILRNWLIFLNNVYFNIV